MMSFDEIRKSLIDRRLEVVAEGTGLHYNTIKNVRDNPTANPTRKVMEALSAYLRGVAVNG